MSNLNPNCCGDHCRHKDSEVRLYPLGGGANLILCKACFQHENRYRLERRESYMRGSKNLVDDRSRAAANWPHVEWSQAKRYPEAST